MELRKYICLIAGLTAISCTETPDFREFQVPENHTLSFSPAKIVSGLNAKTEAISPDMQKPH